MEKVAEYAKGIVAIIVALTITIAAVVDGDVDATEITAITAAWIGALGVISVPNKQPPPEPTAASKKA